MPKISKVLAPPEELSPLQNKILAYLSSHTDEVFSNADAPELAKLIDHPNPNGVKFALWYLVKVGKIGKFKVPKSRTYFGSPAAIRQLQKGIHP